MLEAQETMYRIKLYYRECTMLIKGSFLANAPSRGHTHIILREPKYRPKQSRGFLILIDWRRPCILNPNVCDERGVDGF